MNWYKMANEFNMMDHIKQRGIDPDKTKVYLDEEGNYATFPLYNLSGQMVGYQQYNPFGDKNVHNKEGGKYWNYVSPAHKTMAFWGVESVKPGDPLLFITEGVFDAIKIQNAGLPAIAVLCNDPHQSLKNWLMLLNRRIIAILDNDKAGSKLRNFAHAFYTVPEPYKDLGDMPQEEATEFLATIANE